MDDEHEMCQNCKKDIPIASYRTHTLHCARNMVKCRDCDSMVGKKDLQTHQLEFHTLRICSQCLVNVEAYKLPEHKKTLCSKRKLKCKYCSQEQLASDMTDHENNCGCREEQCDKCYDWVLLRDWDSHQGRYHGSSVRRFRERSVIATTCTKEDIMPSRALVATSSTQDDEDPMLPCEFCEGMIPMRKLLEHQAECVNPTNIRRSESISNLSQISSLSSQSSYRPLSGLRFSYSSLKRSPPTGSRKFSAPSRVSEQNVSLQSGSTTSLPCEFCSELQPMESLMNHQRVCERNPINSSQPESSYDSSSLRRTAVRNLSLNRASSVREARATTEERSLGLGLPRQSSFSERSYSSRRDSIYTRGTLGLSRYTCSPDYAAAARRSALFDGYTGFAIYSSISQGLDEITYGARRSRRSSITDSNYSYSRRGSITGMAYELSSSSVANGSQRCQEELSGGSSAAPSAVNLLANNGSPCRSLSRQDSAYESCPSVSSCLPNSKNPQAVNNLSVAGPLTTAASDTPQRALSREESIKKSSKVERKVSFSGADCVVLREAVPQKPARNKEKTSDKASKSKVESSSKQCHDLLNQVSAKLKVLEQERCGNTDDEFSSLDVSPITRSPLSKAPPTSLFPLGLMEAKPSVDDTQKRPEVKAKVEPPPTKPTNPVPEPVKTSSGLLPCPSVKAPKDSAAVVATSKACQIVAKKAAPVTITTAATSDEGTTVNISATITLPQKPSVQPPPRREPDQISGNGQGVNWAEEKSKSHSNNPHHITATLNSNNVMMNSSINSISSDTTVTLRDKSHPHPGKESKPGSKRNSLDNKTVQTLAQDLAAECAKAYALMESSLSKLSTDFAVGPFGLTPKNKKTRKARAASVTPLK